MFLSLLSDLFYGFLTTCSIFLWTLVFALPLGLIISFGSMCSFKPLRYLVKGFIWIIRGTPLILQIFIVFYGPGLWLGVPMKDRMMAVLIAFIINYACYFSEIYRGGIESVHKGQYEAGYVLGMTKSQIFFRVILLQVIKRVIPPMGNEIITLVKDTSLARVIAVVELIMVAEKVPATYGTDIVMPLLCAGVFYLVFNGLLTIAFMLIEKKLKYFEG